MVAEDLKINEEDIKTYLDILGSRNNNQYCVIALDYMNKTKKGDPTPHRMWLSREQIIPAIKEWNSKGCSVIGSLNDKEKDSNEGTTVLRVLFFDVDVKRDKNVLATQEELEEAFKRAEILLIYIENKYGAKGFIGFSGNGWHVLLPLPKYELLDVKSRLETNGKLMAFCKDTSKECGVEIDKTYDLRRLTAVIGSLNLKIPDKPRKTMWYNSEGKPFDVEGARKQNKALLDAIIGTEVADQKVKPSKLEKKQVKIRKSLAKLVEKDEKLKDLCQLEFDAIQKKYSYKSRSEAEMALLCKLVQSGFSDIEIYDIMEGSLIHSWHERNDAGKSKQIQRARGFIANPEKPKTEVDTPRLTKKVWEVATNPYILDYICKDISRIVKKDMPSKICSFLTALSCYTDDPINLSQKGVSGVGKGHTSTEPTKYFPDEDVWRLMGITPKSIVHSPGILMDEDGQPIALEDKPVEPKRRNFPSGNEGAREYDQELESYKRELKSWNRLIKNSYTWIDLKNKTLLFLDAPSEEVLRILYPILSHDVIRSEYRYTHPKTLVTNRVVLEGFPASIFLDTDKKYLEEFATRTLTTTPESSAEKIKMANIVTNDKLSYPWTYKSDTEECEIIRSLLLAIKHQIIDLGVGVVVPFGLHEIFPKERVRDMRDFKQFGRLLKTLTLLHVFQRPTIKLDDSLYVISSVDDTILSMALYSRILETTRTGTQDTILKFYHDKVKQEPKWTKKELVDEYNKTAKRKRAGDTIGKWLKRLEELQYVDIQPHPDDKRLNVYVPLVKGEKKLEIDRLLGDPTDLRSKLKESLENWIKNVGRNSEFLLYRFSNNKPSMESIEDSVAQQMILKDSLSKETDKIPSIFKELLAVKTEKQTEKGGEKEKPPISSDPKSSRKPRCHLCGEDLLEGQPLSNFDGTRMVHSGCQKRFLKGLETTQKEKAPEGA